MLITQARLGQEVGQTEKIQILLCQILIKILIGLKPGVVNI